MSFKGGTTISCGCINNKKRQERKSNFVDLTGNKYGRLTVLYEVPRGSKKDIQWHCLCECGEETTVGGGQLREEKTRSCGCLRKEQHNLGEDRINAILHKVYSGVMGRRKKRNLLNDLTFDEFKTIICSPCIYCGETNSNYSRDITDGHLITDTVAYFNGLDRINNDVGYTFVNCVPCCKNCNNAKGEMSLEEFLNWVKRAYKYYIGG